MNSTAATAAALEENKRVCEKPAFHILTLSTPRLVSSAAPGGCASPRTAPSAPAENFLLTGATVHTISGETLAPGQVLIRDGKIAAVGNTVPAEGAASIDLTGQHLYPGIIALNTVLGLTEISGVRSTQDTTEVGDDFTPDVESWIAVNPDSELIPVTRANGITCFEPVPQGHIISGQSALLAVAGWTTEQMTIRKPIALHLFWPAMELDTTPKEKARDKAKWKSLEDQAKERRARLRAIEDFFEEAKAYAKAKDAAAKGQAPAPESIPAWEAMLPYVRGELPITIHADEIRQIRAAIQWADTNHYKVILAGGRDAWMAADLLAAKKVPVVYGHTYTQPARDTESYDVHFRAPAVLHRAGVQVTFSLGSDSFDAALIQNLPYSAAQAVAFGLARSRSPQGPDALPRPARRCRRPPRLHRTRQGRDSLCRRRRHPRHPQPRQADVDCRQRSQPRKPPHPPLREIQEPPAARVNGNGI